MTLADRVLAALADSERPLDDDEIAAGLGAVRQAVNQTCRALAVRGVIARGALTGGKITNRLVDRAVPDVADRSVAVEADSPPQFLTEDAVKGAVLNHLTAQGWSVNVAWGRERGIDIDARRGSERLVLEAKGAVPRNAQQVNYFLGALGELIQRMDDPSATYGLALPDNKQYRGLVSRLPALAKERLGLVFYFVARSSGGLCVEPISGVYS